MPYIGLLSYHGPRYTEVVRGGKACFINDFLVDPFYYCWNLPLNQGFGERN